MPAELDAEKRRVSGARYNTADGALGSGPQYSFLNFIVYALIALIALIMFLTLIPLSAGNFRTQAPDAGAPIGARNGP